MEGQSRLDRITQCQVKSWSVTPGNFDLNDKAFPDPGIRATSPTAPALASGFFTTQETLSPSHQEVILME